MFDTQDKLEMFLRLHGIVGAWIERDENGFSRKFRFEICGTTCSVWWFPNYSKINIGGVGEYWFDRIDDEKDVPVVGSWLSFKLGASDKGLRLKIR